MCSRFNVIRGWLRLAFAQALLLPLSSPMAAADSRPSVSGRYPHLAMSNAQGECGTGAVVPWAGKLWVVTYAPHKPEGSDDKLYEIDKLLNQSVRPESVGGTPAGRLIHRESQQLILGPYIIDRQRRVQTLSPQQMPGRLSAVARHLTDPANKVYIYDMEGKVYEVELGTLKSTLLFEKPVPGWHGKGAYSAQGRLVVANNGELKASHKQHSYLAGTEAVGPEDAGALSAWDNKTWEVIERRQFTEVTGPGGIEGAPSDAAPLWSIGWDKRSLLLLVLDGGQWHTFRLPKADASYDGSHGWHTEWPRIRQVVSGKAGGKLLMNMHGGWFDFPASFSARQPMGLRPIGSHLKVTADFAPWQGGIVFGCDDAAQNGFMVDDGLDPRNDLIGRSNSNLWFTNWAGLKQAGRAAGTGGPWLHDAVRQGEASTPYLFAGYAQRVLHVAHECDEPLKITVETGAPTRAGWRRQTQLTVPPHGYAHHIFASNVPGEWLRLVPSGNCSNVTAQLIYGTPGGVKPDRRMFSALADVHGKGDWVSAVARTPSDPTLPLHVMAQTIKRDGTVASPQYFQVAATMQFSPLSAEAPEAKELHKSAALGAPAYKVDEASVVISEGGTNYRLPKSDPAYNNAWPGGWPRSVREVVTERSLLNAHGSFYMLPRPTAGGVRRMKPVATHGKTITDHLSWRGLLVLAGTRANATSDGHHFGVRSGPVGLWFGDVDDLWKLGKPRGYGGPWLRTHVRANEPSDPYLMIGYDRKRMSLSHDCGQAVHMTVEVDPVADGSWYAYRTFEVPAGKTVNHEFPPGYAAHWVRVRSNAECRASVQLQYD